MTKPASYPYRNIYNSMHRKSDMLDKMPSSDHLPLQAEIDVDCNCAFNFIAVNACPRDIVSYK